MKVAVAVAVLCALAAVAWAGESRAPRVVPMNIHHSRFVPDRLTVSAGETVTFRVSNTDPIDHELIIGDEAVQRRHENGTEPEHGAVPGEISIPAGTTRATTYTFEERGTVIFGCHLPGHYDFGMRGKIVVR